MFPLYSRNHNSVLRITSLLIVLAMELILAADPERSDPSLIHDLDIVQRPVLRVPRLEPGSVTGDNRTGFPANSGAKITNFTGVEQPATGSTDRSARFAHDRKRLYVVLAFPASSREADAGRRDDAALWNSDDTADVLVSRGDRRYRFTVNAGGVRGDRRDGQASWDSQNWAATSTVQDGTWRVRFTFDAKLFGLERFSQDASPLLLNVVDRRRGAGTGARWGFLGERETGSDAHMPRLRFASEQAVFQRDQRLGTVWKRRIGMSITLTNPSDQTCSIDVRKALLRSPDPNSEGFYQILEGVTDPGGVEVQPGAGPRQLTRHALKALRRSHVPVEQDHRSVEIKAGEQQEILLTRPVFPGSYLVTWSIRDAKDDQPITGGVHPFVHRSSLNTEIDYYYLTSNRIVAKTTLPEAPVSALRYRVVNSEGNRVAETVRSEVSRGQRVVSRLEASWPPGEYQLHVAAMGPDEEPINEGVTEFKRPEPPFWWGTSAGKRIDVPEPWTPVQAEKNRVSLWNGPAYKWDGSPLPDQIVSRGEPLLASSVRLRMSRDGTTVEWNRDPPELKKKSPDRPVYEGTMHGGGVKATVRTAVEFDGMARFDLTLEPDGNQPARVDRLWLEVPVRKDVAELFRRYKFMGLQPPSERPDDWSDTFPMAGAVDDQTQNFPFVPSIVLLNDERGLEWFAEHDRNWSNPNRERMIEVVPSGESVILRVRLIDQSETISEPETITFGLQRWPVKPWPDAGEPRNISNKTSEGYGVEALRKAREAGMDVFWDFHWNNAYVDGKRVPQDYPALLTEKVRRRLRKHASAAMQVGLPIMGNTAYGLPPGHRDVTFYGREMARYPLEYKGKYGYKPNAASPVFADAFAGRLTKLAREYGWSGIQLDGTYLPRFNNGWHDGTGYRGEDGEWNGRYPIFGYRKTAKRLYNVYHGEVDFDNLDHGFVYSHTNHPIGPIVAFTDRLHGGEGGTMRYDHLRQFDMTAARAIFASQRALGVPRDWLPKHTKAPVGPRGRLAFAYLFGMRMPHNRVLQWLDDNNYEKQSLTVHRMWDAYDWINMHPDRFAGFWASERYLHPPEKPDAHASLFYKIGQRVLLVLGNWSPDRRTLTTRLKREALGLKGAELTAEDAVTGEPVELNDSGVNLEVAGDGYRLIKIRKKK